MKLRWLVFVLASLLAAGFVFNGCEKDEDEDNGVGPANEAPLTPSDPIPADGVTDVSLEVILSWSCSDPDEDPLTYDVYFGTSNNPPLAASAYGNALYDPSSLDPGTTYYWKISATDDSDASTTGPVWSFTTTASVNQPPSTPSNPNPEHGADDISTSTTLSWTCTDADDDPLTYDVYFGTSDNPPQISTNQSGSTYDPGLLTDDVEYFWKIVASDDHDNETSGPVWSFVTDNGAGGWDPGDPPVNPNHGDEWTAHLGMDQIALEMVFIGDGTFMMGAQDGEDGAAADEYPRHQVTISQGFWMGKYEVTQQQWEAVMGIWEFEFIGNPDHPAEQVSYDDISNDFLPLLNAAGPDNAWRLPTEAEWEYGCRAGHDETRFWWGDDPDYSLLSDYAWYDDNSGGMTNSVGQKHPNLWRLYDMSGNVWEWCSDWYDSDYYDECVPSVIDPQGPDTDTYRALRGGSWNFSDDGCRSANRNRNIPSYHSLYYGFRLVRDD